DLLHGDERHESAAGRVRHMHGAYVRQVAPQRVEDLAFAGDAGNQDVIPRHARGDAMEDGVAAHANPVCDEHILRAAVGGVTGELAERTFRLVHVGQDFAFDDDLGAGGHFEIGNPAAGEAVGLAGQPASDLQFSDV